MVYTTEGFIRDKPTSKNTNQNVLSLKAENVTLKITEVHYEKSENSPYKVVPVMHFERSYALSLLGTLFPRTKPSRNGKCLDHRIGHNLTDFGDSCSHSQSLHPNSRMA